jgi:hypothetical protein
MTLKTLTTAELSQEREHLDRRLSELMFKIHTDKDSDNITEMHREWDRRRYHEQIEAINIELETRR